MASSYQVTIHTPAGIPLVMLDRFLSLTLAKSLNTDGALTFTVIANFPAAYCAQDAIIDVLRTPSAPIGVPVPGILSLSADATPRRVFATRFFLTAFTRVDVGGVLTYSITAASASILLTRRIVSSPAGSPRSYKTGPADDLIKAICRENLGSLVTDPARDLTALLSIDPDQSRAPIVTRSFPWLSLKNAIALVARSPLGTTPVPTIFWDVLWSDELQKFRFLTVLNQWGVDHGMTSSAPMIFSRTNGNIISPQLTNDYTNDTNVIYAGGQGLDASRLVTTALDGPRALAAPFARHEFFADQRSIVNAVVLSHAAAELLFASRPLTAFTGTILNSPSAEFQRDWDLGDRVVAMFQELTFDCWINSVSIAIANGTETIAADLHSVR